MKKLCAFLLLLLIIPTTGSCARYNTETPVVPEPVYIEPQEGEILLVNEAAPVAAGFAGASNFMCVLSK
jgi:hypothetical protein